MTQAAFRVGLVRPEKAAPMKNHKQRAEAIGIPCFLFQEREIVHFILYYRIYILDKNSLFEAWLHTSITGAGHRERWFSLRSPVLSRSSTRHAWNWKGL